MRRQLELLYDGRPKAAGDVAAAATRNKAEIAKERERLSVIPDAKVVAALAPAYTNADLGPVAVTRSGSGVSFGFRTFASAMGTKKNDGGTTSFVGLDPVLLFLPVVVGADAGKPNLVIRASQHEFKFVPTEYPGLLLYSFMCGLDRDTLRPGCTHMPLEGIGLGRDNRATSCQMISRRGLLARYPPGYHSDRGLATFVW